MKNISPLFQDLSKYSKSILADDFLAGLTVGIMLIPQGMAYAVLAGLPPIYGLYGGLVPLFLYAIFGSSRQLSIGAVAVSAILVAEGISGLAEPFSPEFIGYVITAGLLIGILQVLFGLFRMGFLVNFLSHPVVGGFTSAAAIIILSSQLGDLLGFKIPRSANLYKTFTYAFQNLGQTNWIALMMCLVSIGFMIGLKKVHRLIPGALIVVVIGTGLSYFLNLESMGLEIVGAVPSGLPNFQVPNLSFEIIQKLIPTVLTVTIIGIVESIGIAKALEAKQQEYIVRPNQELLALGIAKIGGAFFQSLPTSGSFTRSAINNESGAKTGISSIITVFVVIVTLLFLTTAFYYLPKAILAAIILLAVRSLIEYKEAKHLWHSHRRDFYLMMVTFIGTLIFGIEEGVLIGVILSILNVLYRSSRPHIAILGKVPKTTYYRNINRFEKVNHEENALIIRFDNQLFFANASFFKDRVKELLTIDEREIKCLFLDAKSMHDIDSDGLNALRDIYRFLERKDIEFYICGAIGPVRDILKQSGFIKELGENHFFMYLNDGIEAWKEDIT